MNLPVDLLYGGLGKNSVRIKQEPAVDLWVGGWEE